MLKKEKCFLNQKNKSKIVIIIKMNKIIIFLTTKYVGPDDLPQVEFQ